MSHFRPTRLFTTVAMVGSSLLFSGGALLLTASPASAVVAPATGLACNSLVATIDLGTLTVAGTLSGCHGTPGHDPNKSGAIVIHPLDLAGGPSPGSVKWDRKKGNGPTSGIVVTAVIGLGDCSAFPAFPIAATLTSTNVSGPYEGEVGGGVICTDGINIVNATPITF